MPDYLDPFLIFSRNLHTKKMLETTVLNHGWGLWAADKRGEGKDRS